MAVAKCPEAREKRMGIESEAAYCKFASRTSSSQMAVQMRTERKLDGERLC